MAPGRGLVEPPVRIEAEVVPRPRPPEIAFEALGVIPHVELLVVFPPLAESDGEVLAHVGQPHVVPVVPGLELVVVVDHGGAMEVRAPTVL